MYLYVSGPMHACMYVCMNVCMYVCLPQPVKMRHLFCFEKLENDFPNSIKLETILIILAYFINISCQSEES